MQRVTRKIICVLLSSLLILLGQGMVSAQEMAMGDSSAATVKAMSDCGHPGADPSNERSGHSSSNYAEAMAGSPGCDGAENLACLNGAGSGQCVMTVVFAHASAFSFPDTLSQPITARPPLTYLNPFLDVATPPPDLHA